ncbi:sigma-70 family RNA polymerase sigma factor [Leptobacterium flavescens]|uniref:Sigma-70 family RNA polymerase sigma factor n=1 Tax=Leptobacterium flavescens TaxID=472055 RepID=A0A6P0UJG0_9FLAO|nr:sigma-70 family RNA polymerase sigma factor [Leptobacterium flavescens]NER13117.1 sigma-70 family RNA polymerase sigma factor [Leptobacterium flavescens]
MQTTGNKEIIENIFRHEYGKMIAVLVNKYGPSHLDKIEDAVQNALLKAMQVWGYQDTPQKPTAWLIRVANNSLIDMFRKEKYMQEDTGDTGNSENMAEPEEMVMENRINDDQLKMIFACCHPSISEEYQLILSLKLIGGFSNKEIAKALLKKEDTVAKSFTRAKKMLKSKVKTLDTPIEIGLTSRLNVVLKVIYLLFSEGYAASTGEVMLKKDICLEAIRLALLLSRNKYCNKAEVQALIALMCFHTSRFEARLDKEMEAVDLEHQDRSKYDKDLIRFGIDHLETATEMGQTPSPYHLQAAVSYEHCIAPDFEKTNWENILHLYNLQLQYQYSPVIELNRIVPLAKVKGPETALKELQKYQKTDHFRETALFYAIKADIFRMLEDKNKMKTALEKAVALTKNTVEKKYFLKKRKGIL